MRNSYLAALLFLFIACGSFDRDTEVQRIMELHQAQQDYHFNKDSKALVDLLTPDFVSVSEGIVSEPAYQESLDRFNRYFGSVRFLKWDDLTKPVVKFSGDGSLAYVHTRKIVDIKYPVAAGDSLVESTIFAWTSVYRKIKDDWKIEAIISTNKPPNYPPGPRKRLEARLEEFDAAFVAADTKKLNQLVSADYVHTNGSSPPIGKEDWLNYMSSREKSLASGTLRILEYQVTDRRITYLDNTAVVNTRVYSDQVMNGRRRKATFQVTQVWRDERGVWKRAAFHDGRAN